MRICGKFTYFSILIDSPQKKYSSHPSPPKKTPSSVMLDEERGFLFDGK
jgi:hypothetical protein